MSVPIKRPITGDAGFIGPALICHLALHTQYPK